MLPALRVIADRQAGVFSRAQALGAGVTPGEVERLLRSRDWQRVRHGVYQLDEPRDRREAHLRQCWAAVLVARSGSVIAGPSAALVHGLALVDLPALVHVVAGSCRSAGGMNVVRRRTDVDSVDIGGLPLTSVSQTVVDCATVLGYEDAVVVADSALRHGVDRRGLLELAETSRASARVRRVVEFADGRSESVGESLARVALAAAGLPAPLLQEEFVVRGGRRYRVDFYWPDQRTIGEFDGRVKYGEDPGALWSEKRREDELRAEGYGFARFGAAQVRRPAELGAVVRGAFGLARRTA